jgi:hypothetical protein
MTLYNPMQATTCGCLSLVALCTWADVCSTPYPQDSKYRFKWSKQSTAPGNRPQVERRSSGVLAVQVAVYARVVSGVREE